MFLTVYSKQMFIMLVIGLLILTSSVNTSDESYYHILGVSKQASSQEIRHAFKKLAVKYHPDKNPDKAKQEKFLKITEAYDTLKDSNKRHKYDTYGTYEPFNRRNQYHSRADYNNLYGDDLNVNTLTGNSFYEYVNGGLTFINFYSPFCPPCQNLAEDWKKLAKLYKGVIKVAVVNCKHHNIFCYNSMRIRGYPTLLFYPDGKVNNFIVYHDLHRFDALERFVMSFVRKHVSLPVVTQLKNTNKPIAYVVGEDLIDRNILTRIAFRLNGLVTFGIIEDKILKAKLTTDAETVIVFLCNGITTEIQSTDENYIAQEIMDSLPKMEQINREKFRDIRNKLRGGSNIPWAIYFSSGTDDKATLFRIRTSFPDINFGEINCDEQSELCASLQVEAAPAWAVLKAGGAYQRAHTADIHTFLQQAPHIPNLHSLSPSDLTNILDADTGMWVLLVVPWHKSWWRMDTPFTKASWHFHDAGINFGVMICTQITDKYCRRVAVDSDATIVVQNGTKSYYYMGELAEDDLIEFVQALKDNYSVNLNEQDALDIQVVSRREHSWLVAYLPADCRCHLLMHEWRVVAKKLQPLEWIRVGLLRCTTTSGYCENVRMPTARYYPLSSGVHYSVSLERLSQAPLILDWMLRQIGDNSVNVLDWKSFSNVVIAEELYPDTNKKPWLVYFHSPQCYRCYELFPDFAVLAINLHSVINFGKVNCLVERNLCDHEQITSYPSLKLYLNRNHQQAVSRVVPLQIKDFSSMLQDIGPHLIKYNDNILASLPNIDIKGLGLHFQRDEL